MASLIGTALGRDILRYIPGTLGPAAGALAFAAIFTRVFDTVAYGRYSLVYSVALLAGAVFGQWLVQSINRFVAASGDLRGSIALVGTGLSAITLAVLAVGALLLLPGWVVAPSHWRPFLVPGLLLVLGWALYQPLLATYQATLRAGANSSIRLGQTALRLGLAVSVVAGLWRSSAALILAAGLAYGVLAAGMWIRLKAPFAVNPFAIATREPLGRWVRYGFPLILWVACDILLNVGDRYVIQWLRDSAELGVYAANYGMVAGGAGLLAAPIRLAAHPHLMRAWGAGEPDEAAAWLGRIVSAMVFAMVVVIGITLVFAADLARVVLGTEFREGYRVMPIALAGIAFWQLSLYLHKPFEFHERTRAMMGIATLAVAANLVLNVLLVPVWGYIAAAWTTLAAYAIYAVLTGFLGRRLLAWRLDWGRLLGPVAVFSAALVALGALRTWLGTVLGYGTAVGISAAVMIGILGAAGVQLGRLLREPVAAGP